MHEFLMTMRCASFVSHALFFSQARIHAIYMEKLTKRRRCEGKREDGSSEILMKLITNASADQCKSRREKTCREQLSMSAMDLKLRKKFTY